MAFSYNLAKGALAPVQTIGTLPSDFHGKNAAAEIVVHPNGKFLYASNRGHDSIAVFAMNPSTGKLTAAGRYSSGGKTPRAFNIDPAGKFVVVANQDSGTVASFAINPSSGALRSTGASVRIDSPSHVLFSAITGEPDGK